MVEEFRPLALWVLSCSCKCGNKWTHSYPTFHSGGQPAPIEADRGKVTRIYTSPRHFAHCPRCIDVGLPLGWEAQAMPKAKPSLSSLLDD